MINLIAFKDPSLRQTYELKITSSPPTNLTSATGVIKDILRERAAELRVGGAREVGASGALRARPRGRVETVPRLACGALILLHAVRLVGHVAIGARSAPCDAGAAHKMVPRVA